jgi:hypothetical protein
VQLTEILVVPFPAAGLQARQLPPNDSNMYIVTSNLTKLKKRSIMQMLSLRRGFPSIGSHSCFALQPQRVCSARVFLAAHVVQAQLRALVQQEAVHTV